MVRADPVDRGRGKAERVSTRNFYRMLSSYSLRHSSSMKTYQKFRGDIRLDGTQTLNNKIY
jgi:hypothetical protein